MRVRRFPAAIFFRAHWVWFCAVADWHSSGASNGTGAAEFMAVAAVNDMRFLVPVLTRHTMMIEVTVLKMSAEAALVEGVAIVEDTVVTRGRLSFARKTV